MSTHFKHHNKKSLEAIAKANYLIEYVLPDMNNQLHQSYSNKAVKFVEGERDMKYYMIAGQKVDVEGSVSPALLLEAFENIYSVKNSIRINEHSFANTHFFEPTYFQTAKQFRELIDIVILEKNSDYISTTTKTKAPQLTRSLSKNDDATSTNFKDFIAYVVHMQHPQEEKPFVRWETFVEKYEFFSVDVTEKSEKSDSNSQLSSFNVEYSMVFSFSCKKSGSFSFLNYNTQSSFNSKFIDAMFDPVKGNLDRLKKLESYIFQLSELYRDQKAEGAQKQTGIGFEPQLKRQKIIPAESFMEYKKLKEKTYKIYVQQNKKYIDSGEIIDVEMKVQNLVCRFMQEAEFNVELAYQNILEYMKFIAQLRSYSRESFQKYFDMDILIYIGDDKLGRPVVLFKTYNFLADKVHDVQEYVDFLFYMFEIDVFRGKRGYIDDVIILADARNNTSKNFKFEVNKVMIPKGRKHCPRRFYRIYIFGSNTFTYYVYKLVKPLMPAYAEEVIQLYKESKEDYSQVVLKDIDPQVLPEVMGGKNSKVNDVSDNDKSTKWQG